MGKASLRLALAIVLCAAMGSVILYGCGSSGTASLADPMAFYQQARENVQTAESFRIRGEMVMKFADFPGAEDMTIDYDMVYELKSDGEMLAKMDMGMQGLDIEAYIAGDRMYMEMPGGMWVYQDIDLATDLTNVGQALGPQYVMDMLEMAESAEVVAEDADSITYDLVLDYDKMMQGQEQDMEKMLQELKEQGVPGFDAEGFKDLIKDILSEMRFQLTVDKNSGLPTAMQMYMEMDFSAFADMFPEDTFPEGAKMSMDASFELSDYGETFNIQLPDEARDAIPIEDMESQLQT